MAGLETIGSYKDFLGDRVDDAAARTEYTRALTDVAEAERLLPFQRVDVGSLVVEGAVGVYPVEMYQLVPVAREASEA